LDWRDADNLKELGDAEAADYRAANLSYGPRNSYFETIGELIDVMGMTEELYRCVASVLTVYSSSGDVDLASAPIEVKSILLWAKTNKWQDRVWSAEVSSNTSILNPYGLVGGNAYTFVARTTGRGNVAFSLKAVVRILRSSDRAFSVLEWREIFVDGKLEGGCPKGPLTKKRGHLG